MKQIMFLFAIFGALCSVLCAQDSNSQDDIKYLAFMRTPEDVFNQHHPETINVAGFNEITRHFADLPNSKVKPGIGFIFSYLKTDIDTVQVDLKRFLSLSLKTNTPVLVKLDGEQWWQNRPDLWNWWDPELPGYDPNNRNNVEWRWWEPEYAIKIAWRNWGRQLRVLPPPNLMSPAYRNACHEAMDQLMPIVLDWYKALPEDKKYLFIGLNLGWESSIGMNAYYYPNGNDLIDVPEIDDVHKPYIHEDVLSRGYVQIGYASVKTAGIRTSGDINESDIVKVSQMHVEDLCKRAYDFGFPRKKIFSHGVGNPKGEKLYDVALNKYSCPGWSTYDRPDMPESNIGINRCLDISDANQWAATEWLLLAPHEKALWKTAFEKTLNYRNCKYLCVFNWELIRKSPEVIEAAREVIKENAIK